MATNWQTQLKRQVGVSSTLMNDGVEIMNSTTAPFGGQNMPTPWTFINKTS